MKIIRQKMSFNDDSSDSKDDLSCARCQDENEVEKGPNQTFQEIHIHPTLAQSAENNQSSHSTTNNTSHSIPSHPHALAGFGLQLGKNIPRLISKATQGSIKAAQTFWTLSDLRTMLQPRANDPEFLAPLREQDPEKSTTHTFSQCHRQLDELLRTLDQIPNLPNAVRLSLQKDVASVRAALKPLEQGTPALGRAIKGCVNLLNLWPALVPSPLLANQAKTFAYTVAAAAKAVMSVFGSTLRSTADGLPFPLMPGELGRQANEVHFYPALLNVIFLSTELAKRYGSTESRSLAVRVSDHRSFHAAVSICCGMALITPFVWDSLKHRINRLSNTLTRQSAACIDRIGFGQTATRLQSNLKPIEIDQQIRQALQDIWKQIDEQRQAFQSMRLDFTDPALGLELTRTVNSQCTHLLNTINHCAENLAETFALQAPAQSVAQRNPAEEARLNAELASKIALMLLAAGVTGMTVFLIQPDKIGTTDLSADAVVVTSVMAQSVWDRQATQQDAMERFKSMASTSMVMALALSADKLSKFLTPNGLIESSPNAPYYASVVMTLMAMTLPGPIARGAELAMNWTGRSIRSQFFSKDKKELSTLEPDSTLSLRNHLEKLSSFIKHLDGEQQQAYEAYVCDNFNVQYTRLRNTEVSTSQPAASHRREVDLAEIQPAEVA